MKRRILSLFIFLLALATAGQAQSEPDGTPQQIMQPGQAEHNTAYGVNRKSNIIQYPYGYDPQPVLKCSPLRISYILLETGEVVQDADLADKARWTYEVGYQGPKGRQRPLVKVKPVSFNTTTNILISTNRRIYDITLDAPPKQDNSLNPQQAYTRRISFYYPDQQFSAKPSASIPKPDDIDQDPGPKNKDTLSVDLSGPLQDGVVDMATAHLDYDVAQGKYPFSWKPLAVYDNGTHMFIKIPKTVEAASLPSLYKVNEVGEREQINYIFNPRTNTMKTDRILKRAVMIESFRHPGFLGFGTVTKEKELFITRN